MAVSVVRDLGTFEETTFISVVEDSKGGVRGAVRDAAGAERNNAQDGVG